VVLQLPIDGTVQRDVDLEMNLTNDQLRIGINQCELCSLSEYAHVPGTGSLTPDVLFVGEAPGSREAELAIPFVGYAGSLLHLSLSELNFPKEKYYITNAVKCRPPLNQTPAMEYISACKSWLETEIELFKPEVIVCLGVTATQAVLDLPSCSLKQWRGNKYVKKFGDRMLRVFPTYHPSGVLRDESRKAEFQSDFENIRNYCKKNLSW